MKIIFMGTPDFAVPALSSLIKSDDHRVVAVFTAAPKPRNRGMKIDKTPIHKLAEEHDIEVYTPKSLRKGDVAEVIAAIDADIIVVVAYGFIVPKDILEAKKYGCLNVHPSKLPRYRGAAPLQRTIINGDEESAVCIMQMDEGLDTGDIILQEDFVVSKRMKLVELHDKCAEMGARLLLEALDNIERLPRLKQSEVGQSEVGQSAGEHTEDGFLYADKLTKEEGRINWQDSAITIDRKIRGMNPWPGAYFELKGRVIKVIEAEPIAALSGGGGGQAGDIVGNYADIICGTGMLRIHKVKPSGKSEMRWMDFMRGAGEVKNVNCD